MKCRQETQNRFVLLNNSKKSQFFAIYLVLLTMFMCAFVFSLYYFQQKSIGNAIILPNSLLILENQKKIFEFQEESIIRKAAKEVIAESSSSADDFFYNFENKFFDYLTLDEQGQFRSFLFTDTKLNGNEILKENLKDENSQINFFREIYTINVENGILKVERKSLAKYVVLKPDAKNKISFIIIVNYNLDKTYNINLNDLNNL